MKGKMTRLKQFPVRIAPHQKRDLRTQFGALCYRVRKDKVEVLLITTRGRGNWIIPRGWPIEDATPTEAAEREAWEEAGVEGQAMPECVGLYSYTKEQDDGEQLPCMVAVFPVKVKKLRDEFPEAGQRRRKWASLKKAAEIVENAELARIIRAFVPGKGA